MSADEIVLTRNMQVNLEFGSIFAFNAFRNADGIIEVKISVQDEDVEYDKWIRIGDKFKFGGLLWKLDDVENPGEDDWMVFLTREN